MQDEDLSAKAHEEAELSDQADEVERRAVAEAVRKAGCTCAMCTAEAARRAVAEALHVSAVSVLAPQAELDIVEAALLNMDPQSQAAALLELRRQLIMLRIELKATL